MWQALLNLGPGPLLVIGVLIALVLLPIAKSIIKGRKSSSQTPQHPSQPPNPNAGSAIKLMPTKECHRCHKNVAVDSIKCPHCGTELTTEGSNPAQLDRAPGRDR